ncbi:unnamed protein product [Musa acuminata var. zebrina]
MQKDLLTSSDRSTRCHQASIFSHSTSSVENLLFLRAHPVSTNLLCKPSSLTRHPRPFLDLPMIEGYTDIIVLKHFKSGVARWRFYTNIPFYKSWDDQGQHPHSTLLHQKTFFKVAVNSLRSSQGNRSQPVHDASCNRKIRYWYELLALVYKYYREIFHKLKSTTIMH